ncbi:hypothetical protein D6D01_04153 [Aureobasidium pullulans]|uniref:Uncharacterized protein n=1 Tax=Aureobasidium pullulans TaxID=5580 RepID=A0A4S9LDB9_AURPU|nr:hypothetical protein D6D01_04153 [Aureobasidium pullulans]
MTKDSSHTYIHLHRSHHADLLEDFNRTHLPHEEIYVPPQHQPLNPDDEDDVVPEQHAAFGIQRATQRQQEPAWRDLGLDRILNEGPPKTQKQNEQLSKYLGWAEFESTEVRNKILKASPHRLDRKKVVVEEKMRSSKGVHARESAKSDSEQEKLRKPPQILTSLAVQDAAVRLQGALSEVLTVSDRMAHGTLSQLEMDHSLAQAMLQLLDLT